MTRTTRAKEEERERSKEEREARRLCLSLHISLRTMPATQWTDSSTSGSSVKRRSGLRGTPESTGPKPRYPLLLPLQRARAKARRGRCWARPLRTADEASMNKSKSEASMSPWTTMTMRIGKGKGMQRCAKQQTMTRRTTRCKTTTKRNTTMSRRRNERVS